MEQCRRNYDENQINRNASLGLPVEEQDSRRSCFGGNIIPLIITEEELNAHNSYYNRAIKVVDARKLQLGNTR